MTNIRISQEALEVLFTKYPNLRISQIASEVLLQFEYNPANIRISQEALEVLFTTSSNLRMSQVAIEILGSLEGIAPPPPTVGRVLGPPVQTI
jgi:DNA polymerase III delta subunit